MASGRHVIFARSSGLGPRLMTWALTPAARSSVASGHRSVWQLSASSWMSTSVRLEPSLGRALAASRKASVKGPRPRGLRRSRGSMMRSMSMGSARRTTSTSLQSPRRLPKLVRPTRVCGAILVNARRMLSRATTSLLCRVPSIGPHMEPEPSNTIIRAGVIAAGSAGCARTPVAGRLAEGGHGDEPRPQTPTPSAHAKHPCVTFPAASPAAPASPLY